MKDEKKKRNMFLVKRSFSLSRKRNVKAQNNLEFVKLATKISSRRGFFSLSSVVDESETNMCAIENGFGHSQQHNFFVTFLS